MQVCRSSPSEKGNHIKIILALLQSSSTAVVYECAVTLVSLSQTPTAIRAAANCYAQMLTNQSDSNVKLIVLERLEVRHLLLTDQHLGMVTGSPLSRSIKWPVSERKLTLYIFPIPSPSRLILILSSRPRERGVSWLPSYCPRCLPKLASSLMLYTFCGEVDSHQI